MKKQTLLGTFLGLSLLSSATVAHIEQSEPLQSLRQSYFALLGMTFGPMGDMVKGKIEWDNALFTTWANDLNHAAQFGVERGFAPGSDKGMTEPNPTSGPIWMTFRASWIISGRRRPVWQTSQRKEIPQQAASNLSQPVAPAKPATMNTSPRTISTDSLYYPPAGSACHHRRRREWLRRLTWHGPRIGQWG
ncbi:MAG: hypothetical protein CM15mP74_07830 [Halieaceae bacterium]|nr:MAG: hypothetical protein CM15mP74_07830 [Halieaceae bacterium]